MKIIYLTGMPASGKLTIAKELKKTFGFAIVDNHKVNDLFMDLAEDRYLYNQEVSEKIDSVRSIVYDYIKNGKNINKKGIIFTNALADNERDRAMYDKIKSIGDKNEFYHIVLKCSLKSLLTRVKNKDRLKKHKLSEPDALEKVITNNTQYIPNDRYTYVLDNNSSKFNILEKITEIITK